MRYVRRGFGLVLALSSLSMVTGCLGVDVKTRFNEDGSGTMTMKLRISQLLLQRGQEGDAPVPLTKEDLEAAYRGLEGVSVESVEQENTDQDRIITSTVNFKDYSVFKNARDFAGAGATLEKVDGRTVYRVAIGESREAAPARPVPQDARSSALPGASGKPEAESVSSSEGERPDGVQADGDASTGADGQDANEQAMRAMLARLVEGYSVSYTVAAPRRIVSHTLGELSADGRSAHYTISMSDYLDLKQPVMFEVKW